jgi:hypothetical protein
VEHVALSYDCVVSLVCVRTPKVNHIAGISDEFQTMVVKCVQSVCDELHTMHRRQSGELMKWEPSVAERRLYAFVLATNAELESLLGTVDNETRTKTTQRTLLTGVFFTPLSLPNSSYLTSQRYAR